MFLGGEHAYSGLVISSGFLDALLHQGFSVSLALGIPHDVEAMYVDIALDENGGPGLFKGRILDEGSSVALFFEKWTAFADSLAEPAFLFVYAFVARLFPDYAADGIVFD